MNIGECPLGDEAVKPGPKGDEAGVSSALPRGDSSWMMVDPVADTDFDDSEFGGYTWNDFMAEELDHLVDLDAVGWDDPY